MLLTSLAESVTTIAAVIPEVRSVTSVSSVPSAAPSTVPLASAAAAALRFIPFFFFGGSVARKLAAKSPLHSTSRVAPKSTTNPNNQSNNNQSIVNGAHSIILHARTKTHKAPKQKIPGEGGQASRMSAEKILPAASAVDEATPAISAVAAAAVVASAL